MNTIEKPGDGPQPFDPGAARRTKTSRWGKPRRIAVAGIAAGLVVAGAGLGFGFGIGSQAQATMSAKASSAESVLAAPEEDRGSLGWDSSGLGSSSGARGSSASVSSVSATDAQEVGVVIIDTVLGYQDSHAAGTGLVLTSNGTILTNNHVVEGSTSITVTIASTGASYNATVVGTDASKDVAVLQLDGASGLATATIDQSATVAVGDAITGVGNALGTGELSAAGGLVSNLEQSITATDESGANAEKLTGLIEVDADIQSGDSGGPLYNSEGEVIGIDTAASSGSSDITGYAIPIEDALSVAQQIVSGVDSDTITLGYPAFLGVSRADDSAATAGSRGVTGATISGVLTSGPAAAAGMKGGDTITAVNGVAVTSAASLSAAIAGYAPGDNVSVTWTTQSGTTQTATLTLVKGPAD